MNKRLVLATALALASGIASAGEITPVNMDAPGTGLNDTTPAAPVGGNPGITIGEQRRIVYQFAADLWGAVLQNDAEIRVEASFQPLSCGATSGVLGSAGAKRIFANYDGMVEDTWYGGALANAITGTDVHTDNEIASRFNVNLGQTGCLTGSGWYYGLDGKTPANRINFLDVVMHELGHGLNFQGFYSLTTGAPAGTAPNNFPDIYSRNVYDNATSMAWTAMTNAQRVTAAIGGNLVWTGATVGAQVPTTLAQVTTFNTTGDITASYGVNPAGYGPFPTAANFASGDIVLANDGSGTPTLGCVATPAGAYTGKVVLVDRGTCSFKTKTLNAQNSGAVAVAVVNNAAGFPPMGDDAAVTATITVPSVGILQADGNAIKAVLPGVNGGLVAVPGSYFGTDANGRPRLYSPNPLEGGSNFSHFDVTATRNALMEPAINQDLDGNLRVDLTTALFEDEGWELNHATTKLRGTCDTLLPGVSASGGVITGANAAAADAMCRTRSDGATPVYRKCMAPFIKALEESGLATAPQVAAFKACATK